MRVQADVSTGKRQSRGLRDVLATFATGVTVVTAPGSPAPSGVTVNSFASVSLEPPLVLFCLCRGSGTGESIRRAGVFAVNILTRQQKDVCLRFAGQTDGDRFGTCRTIPGATGAPMLADALAFLDCEVTSIQRQGDHDLIVGRVRSAQVMDDNAEPLIFFRGAFH